jgi:hypothetical protein
MNYETKNEVCENNRATEDMVHVHQHPTQCYLH